MGVEKMKDKMIDMLGLKLSLGQVLSSFVVVIPTIIGTITYLNQTYETKANVAELHANRVAETARLDKRIDKIEDAQASLQTVQSQTYAEVKEISGYLRAKSERK
jgi:hypothetical protein